MSDEAKMLLRFGRNWEIRGDRSVFINASKEITVRADPDETGIALAVYDAMASEVATLRKERDEALDLAGCHNADDAVARLRARIASREGEK